MGWCRGCSLRERTVPPWGGPAAAPRLVCLAAALGLVAGCGAPGPRPVERDTPPVAKPAPLKPSYVLKRGGGFYQDDGPGEGVPDNLDAVPDAEPRMEPLHRFANNPYSVLGRDYVPAKELRPYKARGVASWYGRKFHGQRTSSGEPYDMFAMTAAHPTLPIPSYARVTHLGSGKSVVVRVNDRGPFLHERIIDLSYAAAWKLGYIGSGSAQVEVESILPGETLLAAAPPPRTDDLSDPIAALVAAAPVEPAPLPAVREARGVFLQLGAFGNPDNAESFRVRLQQQLAWLAEPIRIAPREGVFRLHLGPYRTAQEAGRVAERIRETLDLNAFIVQH